MNTPEVQQIMGDPAMRMILEQMQTDPQVSGKDSHVLCQLEMSILEKERGQGRIPCKIHPIVFPVPTIDLTADKVSTFVAQLKIRGIY